MINGWVPTSLGDILMQERRPVVLDPEKKYAEIGVYSYGRGIFHKEPRTGFEVGNKDLYEIKQGDFIFQITFAWEGAIALASEAEDGMYGSVRFPTYRVNEDICYPKFLLNYFKTEEGRRDVGRISPGSAGRNRVLATKRLPEIFVLLPPLDEQRRIVERIEALAARIAKAQSLRKEADIGTEALLAAGTRKIFDKHSWKMISIEELIGRENLKNGKSLKSDEQPSEVSCLRISAMRNGKIDCKDTKPISMTIEEAKQYRVYINDVFIVRGNGSKELVGRAGLIEECRNIVIFPDLFIKVPLDETKILPTFFVAWWNSPVMREKIVDLAKTTSGIWKINQGHIASCEIPLPPLDEQRRIVAYLDGVQAKVASLRELQSAAGEELDALLLSVLDRAFKGEL